MECGIRAADTADEEDGSLVYSSSVDAEGTSYAAFSTARASEHSSSGSSMSSSQLTRDSYVDDSREVSGEAMYQAV